MKSAFDAEKGTLYAAIALAALYAGAVCANGIPALRHDWWWPITHNGFVDFFWNSTSGWVPNGLGYAYPYPGSYVMGCFVSAAGFLLGPLAALALLAFAMGLACTLGARSIGIAAQTTPLQIYALELFAIANPWVYNKTVAGHTYMILAFGALMGIAAELMRKEPRAGVTSLLVVLTLGQLQFFLIAMLGLTIHAILRRSYLPCLTGVVIATPIWLGLIMDRSGLLTTPYTLSWQISQSVDPLQAVILRGYFTQYDSHIATIQNIALWLIFACTALGILTGRWRRLSIGAAVMAAAFLIFAMGVKGPMGSAYTILVTRVPETGVFRELYDVLGFVAIAYVVILALSPSWRLLATVQFAAAVALAAAWFTFPPSNLWVNSRSLPIVRFQAPPNTRFVLLPSFQPMQFKGRGSGADRDTYMRPGNVTSLNMYVARYPVDVGLASFTRTHREADLQALSVSTIVARPWLQSDRQSLRLQLNERLSFPAPKRFSSRRIAAAPEMTIGDLPIAGSLVNRLGSGNELFSDAGLGAIVPVRPSNILVDESKGWADVRFDYIAHPELGQALGGVVTTNPDAVFPFAPLARTLVNVSGTLYAKDGRLITNDTRGYRWIAIAHAVTGLRCSGRCVIAAQTPQSSLPPLNPPPRRAEGLAFSAFSPWFVRAAVPPGQIRLLRYNVAFDPNWIALFHGSVLPHERIDGTVNGWTLPQRTDMSAVYILHVPSGLQSIGELAGICWIALLVAYGFRECRRPSAASTRS